MSPKNGKPSPLCYLTQSFGRDTCLFQRHLHKSESNRLDPNLNFVCQFHYIQNNTCNICSHVCFCAVLHMSLTLKHGKSLVFWDCNAPADKAIELMYSPWFWSFCLIGLKFFSTFNLHGAVNYFIRSKGTKIFNFNDMNLQEKIYRNKFIKIIAILSNIYTIKIVQTFKWTFVLNRFIFNLIKCCHKYIWGCIKKIPDSICCDYTHTIHGKCTCS